MDRCASCNATLFVGADWCTQCFAPVLVAAAATVPGPVAAFGSGTQLAPAAAPIPYDGPVAWTPPVVVVEPTAAAKAAERAIAHPLAAILLLGALVQVGLYLYSRDGSREVVTYLRVGQWVILGFYAVVLAVVAGVARRVDFAPIWSVGPTAENVALGAFKGVATAAVVMGIHSLSTGRMQVASSVKFELGDATLAGVVLALLGLVVAAPVVEELLFRGLAAESMRHRGERVALIASGVLFALWHMRMGGILYYTVMGVVLGRSYWKRGLASSMAAHAGFNGTLVIVALLFIVGPGSTLRAEGVTVEVPGGWDRVEVPVPGSVLAAHGPSAAVFYVRRDDVPFAGVPLVDLARAIERNGIGVPGITVVPGTARVVEYPAGPGIRVQLDSGGRRGEFVVFVKGTVGWTVALEHGTDRSRRDFEGMLTTLQLPEEPTPVGNP